MVIKVTDKQLDELCSVLENVLDDQDVRDAWDVIGNFRSKLEYYDMVIRIRPKECTAEEYKLAKDGEYPTHNH
mgnify:CR=1 FL=1